jgi:hypothetical protein
MGQQNEQSPHSELESQYALRSIASSTVEGPPPPTAADRLYQIAALTAGFFLLATLL